MSKLTFDDIDKLVAISQKSLENRYLEIGNEKGEPYYRFLYHLVHAIKPKLSLEIGVGRGLGSAHMCVASSPVNAEHNHVIGIDIDTSVLTQCLHSYYNNYHFFSSNSTSLHAEKCISALVEKYGKIGIVFQDSSHHYEESCEEWDIYSQFLDQNAIWICDDITPDFHDPNIDPPGKGMVQYFDERAGEKRLYTNLHHGSIMGMILV